jgi:hypothetical protein
MVIIHLYYHTKVTRINQLLLKVTACIISFRKFHLLFLNMISLWFLFKITHNLYILFINLFIIRNFCSFSQKRLWYLVACRLSQILHYICSMIALLSCISVSLSLTFYDSDIDLHIWNTTKTELSKPIIAYLLHRSSKIFIIDTLRLVWAIGETILRTLSTPCLYDYFTTFYNF